jgi:hypothetical protein
MFLISVIVTSSIFVVLATTLVLCIVVASLKELSLFVEGVDVIMVTLLLSILMIFPGVFFFFKQKGEKYYY